MPACAPNAVEKLASTEMWSTMSVELTLSIPRPPYSSGTSTAVNPSSAALRSSRRHRARLFSLDRRNARQNLLARESLRRRRNLPLLLAQVFRSENLIRRARFDQEAAARGGNNGRCGVHWREGPPAKSDPKKACPMRQPYASGSSLRNQPSPSHSRSASSYRVASNRNHARRSASSIHTSIKLVVA